MAQLSNRSQSLDNAGDDGWSVYYGAQEMAGRGQKVTLLCVGDHDTDVAPFVLDAMDASARAGKTGYAPGLGTRALRDAIAKNTTQTTGVPTTHDNVAITSGGQAALFSAISTCIDPGDRVITIDPYYTTYPATIRGAGGVFEAVGADPSRGFQPDFDALNAACAGAKALLINTPNNPTGAVYTPETMDAIAQLCIEHDLWLISDEVYQTQVYSGEHISPRSIKSIQERSVIIGSFSKSHLMTGFRVGWVVAPPKVILAMRSLGNATTYGTPEFVQDAALAALQNGGEEHVSALYRRRRDIAQGIFEDQNIVPLSPAQGAMYVMLDIRKTGLSGHSFAHRLLEKKHIAVMPGESFGNAAKGYIRIALTQDEKTLELALKELKSFAQEIINEVA